MSLYLSLFPDLSGHLPKGFGSGVGQPADTSWTKTRRRGDDMTNMTRVGAGVNLVWSNFTCLQVVACGNAGTAIMAGTAFRSCAQIMVSAINIVVTCFGWEALKPHALCRTNWASRDYGQRWSEF